MVTSDTGVQQQKLINHTQLALLPFSQSLAAVVSYKANDGVVYASKRGLSTIPHCLKWYKLGQRGHLPISASRDPVYAIYVFGR